MDIRKILLASVWGDIENLILYWVTRDKAAFVRIEGGLHRQVFTNLVNPDLLPEQEIELLYISDDRKKHLLYLYSLLMPGTALVVCDSDAELEDRIGEPLIC